MCFVALYAAVAFPTPFQCDPATILLAPALHLCLTHANELQLSFWDLLLVKINLVEF